MSTTLAAYSDSQGRIKLLAPAGWSCQAQYGADGSGGITVYPAGQPVPGASVPANSAAEAIIGTQTSACYTCGLGQACPLFASAAGTYRSYLGKPCATPPPGQTVSPVSSGIVAFQDPPGMAGTGTPSGGQNPANGVMTYYPDNRNGSWVETCTLPAAQRAVCTAILNAFIASYGQL